MADLMDDGDSFEIDCAGCGNRILVDGYKVRPHNAETLRTIISKHGDIGANCGVGSVTARSLLVELVCETLQELMATKLENISVNKINYLKDSLTDIEREGIEITWLKTRLDEILEAKQAIPMLKQSSDLRHLRAEHKTKIQVLGELLNIYERDLSTLQEKLKATRAELSQNEDEVRKIDSKISESKAKLQQLVRLGTLVGDLV